MRVLRIGIAMLCLCFIAQAGATASTSLHGVTPPLAAKIRSIVSSCGSRVISSVRHSYVAGSHHLSQHANGTAVDITGNPACIYAHLRGWNRRGGGYSSDYGRVHHVHVSYGGREAGLVFRHDGHHHRRVHYAAQEPMPGMAMRTYAY